MLSFYLQREVKTLKTSTHTLTIYNDKDLTYFTVNETGAMVAVKMKEHPAVNSTEDGLLECRYRPYKTRTEKTSPKKKQHTYLVTKKRNPDDKYLIYPSKEDNKPKPLYYGKPCYIIYGSDILEANPETGKLQTVNHNT